MKLQDRFVIALKARGYQQAESRARYLVFRGPAIHPLSDNEPDTMRILVGASGALRWTTGRIDASHPFSDKAKQRLLDSAPNKAKPVAFELIL